MEPIDFKIFLAFLTEILENIPKITYNHLIW